MMGQPAKDRTVLFLVAVVALAYFLRLYPYLASGVPYHTDTYPQLANARTLVASTPVPLSPSGGFDGYNIFWPEGTLFYALSSVVLGASPAASMPMLAPLVTSLMAVLFFALLRSLDLDLRTSAVATVLFAVAGGTTMISTGVTKEGFALPLMLLVVLLLNLWLQRGDRGALALSFFAFGGLLAAHSLTSVVGLLLAAYLALTYAFVPGGSRPRALVAVCALAVYTALAYVYFYVYAVSRLPYNLQPSDVVSLVAYEVLLTAPVWLSAAFRLNLHKWSGLWLGAVALGVSGLFASALVFHTLLDSPIASPYVVALVAPYLAVALLAAYGMSASRRTSGLTGPVFASLWALGLLGVVGFTVFSTPGEVGTSLRILDFVYPGAAILGALALSALMGSGRTLRVASIAAVALLVLGSAYIVPYSAFWSGPLGGSQRTYSAADVSLVQWAARAPANQTTYGDVRIVYLASFYTGKTINAEGGYLYLAGVQGLGSGCLLVSDLIGQVGYVWLTYGLPVNTTVLAGLAGEPSLAAVYSNGPGQAYCSSTK